MPRFSKYLFQIAFVIIAINILGLWGISVLQQRQLAQLLIQKSDTTVVSPIIYSTDGGKTVIQTADVSSISGQLNTLNEKTDNLQTKIEEQETDITTLQKDVKSLQDSSTSTATSTTPLTSGVREYSLFIGSGSSSSLQWTDIDSAVIIVNSDNYSNISEVRFEAALSILGGNAYARLVNKANGQVIAQSEVSHNTSTSTWITSNPIILNSGTTTYIVQLRSSSGEKVSLNGARLRIVTE